MIVVLIGPPGSGKSTQGYLLSKEYNIPFIGVGDLVRDMIHSDRNEYAQEVNSGNLLPDDIVFNIVKTELEKHKLQQGVLIEGYPRTIRQAELLDDFLKNNQVMLNCVLYLNNVSQKQLSNRISGRYQCQNCGATYPKERVPLNLLCSRCNVQLVPREDDASESLVCRMKEYQKKSLPVCEYYKKTDRICAIDASKSIEEVFTLSKNCLEKDNDDPFKK
jgi:adenylate kinase